MEIEQFLALLHKVRKAGKDKWMACCPGHDDKKPSMGVAVTHDGTILVHCFSGGCDVSQITGGVGLAPADLFPPRDRSWKTSGGPEGHFRIGKVPFSAQDIVAVIAREGIHVAIAASDMDEGRPLSEDARTRLSVALTRILSALEFIGG